MTIESFPLLGIALAIVGAAVLAIGNILQSRAVNAPAAVASAGAAWAASAASSGSAAPSAGLGASAIVRLLKNREWLLGGGCILAAIALQMVSMSFAPLIVVQPIGVAALVFTAIITARMTRTRPSRGEMLSIATCVVGLSGFVTIAALVSTQSTIGATQLIAVLVTLGAVLVVALAVFLMNRGRSIRPIVYVLLGGAFSGFVAALGKTVILRVQTAWHTRDLSLDPSNLLTIGCLVGIAVAGLLSMYFIQTAHAANKPEVVVGGLTVIDPFVAIVLAVTILGEAAHAPLWAIIGFVVSGAVAVAGVFALARSQADAE